jgi:uncharacterized linocin/CFP29 family protein
LNISILSQREEIMATATEFIANETEIVNAISVLRHAGIDDDLLDKIELDRRLKISLEQFERGETMPAEEAIKKIREKLNNGYYIKQRRN